MVIRGIEHINLRAAGKRFAALRTFYCEVLGLEVGARPPLRSSGLWLYAGRAPIVHLVEVAETSAGDARGSESPAFDHVAFACVGLQRMLAKLQRLGIEHILNEVAATGQTQVRVRDPAGLTVELIFELDDSRSPE